MVDVVTLRRKLSVHCGASAPFKSYVVLEDQQPASNEIVINKKKTTNIVFHCLITIKTIL